MTIDEAIFILCESHTRDDPACGFLVEATPSPYFRRFSTSEYLAAWKALRAHIRFHGDAPEADAGDDAEEQGSRS